MGFIGAEKKLLVELNLNEWREFNFDLISLRQDDDLREE